MATGNFIRYNTSRDVLSCFKNQTAKTIRDHAFNGFIILSQCFFEDLQ